MKYLHKKFFVGVFVLLLFPYCKTIPSRDAKPDVIGPKLHIYLLETGTSEFSDRKVIQDKRYEFAEISLAFQNVSNEDYVVDLRLIFDDSKSESEYSTSIDSKQCCNIFEEMPKLFDTATILADPFLLNLHPGEMEKRRLYYLVKKGDYPQELTLYHSLNNGKSGKDGLEKIAVIPIKK
ncbi:hypothetical protein JWG41_00465 [Leptospira sp. 201903075]|uniref:hypothetical protein n=1 Tax=Leptospira chreensis TaxID=2810035 RepID=UPI001965C207|nr:hypothetical protein [Leptospira chreensis]MBM9588901.1 hypothetical protein [Leptospira chreensis]